MSYPNVLNYTSTNKITIQDVRETCQEENDVLQQSIIDAINEVNNTLSTKQEFVPLTSNITRAMGDYWFSIDGTIPPGGLPHLGHLVSRTTYGDFYSWLSSTKTVMTDAEWLAYAESHGGCCPYYSSGDGSTTFRTPKYDNAFLKTISSINGAGVYEEEGLPDPQLDILFRQDSTSSGVYNDIYGTDGKTGSAYSNSSGTDEWMQSASVNGNTLTPFAVRAENPVYGSSDHVTPKNLSFMIGVYAVGAIAPVGTTDAEKIMSGVTRVEGLLDTKVDKENYNKTAYIIEKWNSGVDWYRVWSDGWIEQGGVIPSSATSVTLLKSYKDTNYGVLMVGRNYGNADQTLGMKTNTNTSFTIATSSYIRSWYAYGY